LRARNTSYHCRMILRSTRVLFVLSFTPTVVVQANPSTLIPRNHYPSPVAITVMAPKKKTTTATDDSAVLQELKDTIRKQAAEIDKLRKSKVISVEPVSFHNARSTSTSSTASHGHHGPEVSVEEISHYLSHSFLHVARHRVGWLGLFLISLSLTAFIMNNFEHTLSRQLELAYFVPLLAGHGGNTGGQAVGTVLSAISAGIVTVKDAPRVIAKEAAAGIVVGTLLGCMVAPIVHYGMGISSHVATVILFTLPLVSTIAATLGSSIPFACLALGLDPSVIAGPAMTSFVDVSGLMGYFLIANRVFKYFGIDL
jgi:cation transporter-like permease